MSDESKAESFCTLLIFVTVVSILVSAPWWMPIVGAALEPKTIVVMECAK